MQQRTIIVTGAWQSGKSTFLRGVGTSLPTESMLPTKDGYQTRVKHVIVPLGAESELIVYETVGRQILDYILDYIPPVIGFIVMANSVDPTTFRPVKSILETFRPYAPLPVLVVANKQDLPEAWSLADLRVALRLLDTMPLVPCFATDPRCVKEVLLTLLKQALTSEDYQAACTTLGVML